MDTLEIAKALIARPSVTPEDAGCQDWLVEQLEPYGFVAERLPYGEVHNLWLRRGTAAPLLVFAGHTDVVPTGPESQWQSPPFAPTERAGYLYGRGAADMKSGVAAMVSACQAFVSAYPEHAGSVALLITSDEEGAAIDGTARVIETLTGRGETIDWCLVGEPSSTNQLGDTIRIGRRGSLSGRLTVHGKQGHVAYPQAAANPIHRAARPLAELIATDWDQGNEHFPPTTFQIATINAGTGALNVVPGTLEVGFNLRYSTEVTAEGLKARIEGMLDDHGLNYELAWTLSGEPFLTEPGRLVTTCQDAVEVLTGQRPVLSTAGGTSDGRFIAPTGAQVLELGPVNATIHAVDECVRVDDLRRLSEIYQLILARLLVQ